MSDLAHFRYTRNGLPAGWCRARKLIEATALEGWLRNAFAPPRQTPQRPPLLSPLLGPVDGCVGRVGADGLVRE